MVLRECPSACEWHGLVRREKVSVVFENPQVRHRGMRVEIPHPAGVPCPTVASPMRFSATPVTYDTPPPLLGEHTREVLRGVLGLGGAEIDALAAEGVI